MKRNKKKHFLYIVLSCILIFSNPAMVYATSTEDTTTSAETTATTETSEDTTTSDTWPDGPTVTAKSAIVMDASTGVVLYEKDSQEAMYPASITKILTTLLAIENCSLSETVTFSYDSIFNVDRDSSLIGIDVGEELSLEDCLYAILLNSANEVSYAVAEHVGGTYDNFVQMMNDKATELGCVNSHFNNPHGLPDEDHYTCAYDMALISRAAIQNTTFAKITGTRTYTIGPTNIQSESRYLANHHKFVLYTDRYEGTIGGKTGWTTKSGYTLVTFAERDGMTLISVVMGCDSSDAQYSDTSTLLDYGFDNFTLYDLSSSSSTSEVLEDSPFFTKYSTLLSSSDSLLSAGNDGYVILPNSAKLADVERDVTFSSLSELVEGENVIGSVTYTLEGRTVGQTDIVYHNVDSTSLPAVSIGELTTKSTSSSISLSNQTTTSKKDLKPLIVIAILGIIIIIFLLYYFLVAKPRARKRKAYYRRRMARRNHHDHF